MLARALLATTAAAAVLAGTAEALQLNLTAISSAQGESTLECWQLATPFASSSTPGTAGALSLALGASDSTSLAVIPPKFDGGLHNAPVLQFVYFTSGLAHISLPNGTDEVWVQGGRYGLIIAADTSDVSDHGHRTQYPGNADTVAVQVPLAPGQALDHAVLHSGPCRMEELAGS